MNRLYRPTGDRVIGGVAAGLANYFNVDPVLIRLLWVFSFFFRRRRFFCLYHRLDHHPRSTG